MQSVTHRINKLFTIKSKDKLIYSIFYRNIDRTKDIPLDIITFLKHYDVTLDIHSEVQSLFGIENTVPQ